MGIGRAELAGAIEAALFRNLRHTAIIRLSEENASQALVSSITGHSLRSID